MLEDESDDECVESSNSYSDSKGDIVLTELNSEAGNGESEQESMRLFHH